MYFVGVDRIKINTMNVTNNRFLALAGIVGPILFALATVIFGNLRFGYSHLHHFISELGATDTPNALLMNAAGFIPTGILIAIFGISLLMMLKKQKNTLIGSTLIIIFGSGILVDGFFSCDAGCPEGGSMENLIHNSIAPLAFVSAIVGIGLLGFSFRKMQDFHFLWKYSILSSSISFIFLLALIASLDSRQFTGLWQRLLLFSIFLWCGIIGMRIFKIGKGKPIDNNSAVVE